MIAGARLKVTRRCSRRQLLLSPYGDAKGGHTVEEMRNFYGYATARSSLKYQTLFHGAVAMGNHHHQDVTDVLGVLPNYKDSLHSTIARGLNCRLGRHDSYWSGGGSCDTTTLSDDQTLKDLAYTDCNPVQDGLVKWGHLWPGFTTYGWRFGETRVFTRPSWFFDPANPDNPPTIALTRVRPRGIFPELSDDALSDKLMELCVEIQRSKQRAYKEQNRRFMGLKKLAKQRWWDKPKSWEDRFTTRPTVASSDKWRRIARLQEDKRWRDAYAICLVERSKGLDPEFPYGTWFLRVHHNVRVAAPP